MNDKYINIIEDEYKSAYLRYKQGDRRDTYYSSHQPILIHVLNTITKGNVLEFGVGHHSTPIMHTICKKQNRKLLSIETDQNWLNKFTHYRNNYHSLEITDPKEFLGNHYIFNEKYAIAFIDGSPTNIRQPVIEKINADYIIVHDTQFVLNNNKNVYNYDFTMFRHVYHFEFFKTMTSILSNLDEVNKNILL